MGCPQTSGSLLAGDCLDRGLQEQVCWEHLSVSCINGEACCGERSCPARGPLSLSLSPYRRLVSLVHTVTCRRYQPDGRCSSEVSRWGGTCLETAPSLRLHPVPGSRGLRPGLSGPVSSRSGQDNAGRLLFVHSLWSQCYRSRAGPPCISFVMLESPWSEVRARVPRDGFLHPNRTLFPGLWTQRHCEGHLWREGVLFYRGRGP